MLVITIPETEMFDEVTSEFYYTKSVDITLEHSLVSLSKWESKWEKPFLTKNTKTIEETLDYIKCMTITQNVKPEVYTFINKEIFDKVAEYIDAPMTATTFSKDENARPNREIITSEIIYYWMIAFNIPFECQKWHLNRLLTLIKVCNIKNTPPKKLGKKALYSRNAALNAARRRQLNTSG